MGGLLNLTINYHLAMHVVQYHIQVPCMYHTLIITLGAALLLGTGNSQSLHCDHSPFTSMYASLCNQVKFKSSYHPQNSRSAVASYTYTVHNQVSIVHYSTGSECC